MTTPKGPAWAYSVAIPHRRYHPEAVARNARAWLDYERRLIRYQDFDFIVSENAMTFHFDDPVLATEFKLRFVG